MSALKYWGIAISMSVVFSTSTALSQQIVAVEIGIGNNMKRTFALEYFPQGPDSVEIDYLSGGDNVQKIKTRLANLQTAAQRNELSRAILLKKDVETFAVSSLVGELTPMLEDTTLLVTVTEFHVSFQGKDISTHPLVCERSREDLATFLFGAKVVSVPFSLINRTYADSITRFVDSLGIPDTLSNVVMNELIVNGRVSSPQHNFVSAMDLAANQDTALLGYITWRDYQTKIPVEVSGASSLISILYPFMSFGYEPIDTIGNFVPTSLSLGFVDGCINDIISEGRFYWLSDSSMSNPVSLAFHNDLPIPIGTSSQIDYLNGFENIYLSGGQLVYKNEKGTPRLDLARLVFYHRMPLVTGNYVPRQGTAHLDGLNKTSTIELRKKQFTDDFDIRIYTDLTGLEKNSPNGLIQTEGRYNILLNAQPLSSKFASGLGFSSLYAGSIILAFRKNQETYARVGYILLAGLAPFFYSSALGADAVLLNRISPFVSFSRIENKNELSLQSTKNTSGLYDVNPVKTFDLLKFSNLTIGANLTFAKLTYVGSNLSLELNLEGGFYRTPIDTILYPQGVVSLLNSTSLLSWYLLPEVDIKPIFSDRIEYDLAFGLVHSRLIDRMPDNGFEEINPIQHGDFIYRVRFSFNIFPNPTDRGSWIFLRSTVFINGDDSNLSLQIGYSTSITRLVGGE